MSPDKMIETFLIIGSIIALLVVGSVIALRSGVSDLETGRDYLQVVGNLSQMILRVAGYVVILVVVHYMIGLRPSLGW